jgi:hypothetical protein
MDPCAQKSGPRCRGHPATKFPRQVVVDRIALRNTTHAESDSAHSAGDVATRHVPLWQCDRAWSEPLFTRELQQIKIMVDRVK